MGRQKMSHGLVALTGATSMSAMWIARAFSQSGFEIHGLCSRELQDYSDLKKQRLHWMKSFVNLHFDLPSENGFMEKWIDRYRPQLWIHHHHHMENYRLQNYDLNQSKKTDLEPLPGIVKALHNGGCRGILFSGSYFEPEEGNSTQKNTIPVATPYGKSKAIVSQDISKFSEEFGVPLSKIVIPDVVGPMEDPSRLIPEVVQCARQNGVFELRTPKQVADHLPAEAIGLHFVQVAETLLQGRPQITRPSGWIGPNKDWLAEIQKNLLIPLNLNLNIKVSPGSKEEETIRATYQAHDENKVYRTNNSSEKLTVNWEEFWRNYEKYLETGNPW